jgi:fatty acid-binding protein DegV
MRRYVHTNFIVDNLDYLARSGQVSPRIAAICKAVMVHPVIEMKGGKMKVSQIFFGSRARSWTRYIASCLSNVSDTDTTQLFITYVGLSKKDLDFIRGIVEKRLHFDNVYFQKAAPAIAVNSGPGTFGLLFARKM